MRIKRNGTFISCFHASGGLDLECGRFDHERKTPKKRFKCLDQSKTELCPNKNLYRVHPWNKIVTLHDWLTAVYTLTTPGCCRPSMLTFFSNIYNANNRIAEIAI